MDQRRKISEKKYNSSLKGKRAKQKYQSSKKGKEYYRRYYYERGGREAISRYMGRLKMALVAYLGGKCVNCGLTDIRLLCANHLNGKGGRELKNKGYQRIYREILAGKRGGEFDLRCYNCNILYEYETGRRKRFMKRKEKKKEEVK
jgi:hypothetical protein